MYFTGFICKLECFHRTGQVFVLISSVLGKVVKLSQQTFWEDSSWGDEGRQITWPGSFHRQKFTYLSLSIINLLFVIYHFQLFTPLQHLSIFKFEINKIFVKIKVSFLYKMFVILWSWYHAFFSNIWGSKSFTRLLWRQSVLALIIVHSLYVGQLLQT